MAKGCTSRHRDCGTRPCDCQELRCLMECSPRALGIPFLLLWATGASPLPKRSLQGILRILGCLKLQAVLRNQLTATKAPEKYPTALRISALSLAHAKRRKIYLWKKSQWQRNSPTTAGLWKVSKRLYRLQEHYTSSKLCCSGGGKCRKWNTRFYLTCSYWVYWYATQNITEGNYLCQQ